MSADAAARNAVEEAWTVRRGPGPIVAAAVHDGHALRPEVAERMALPEESRFREEDPYTGEWTAVAETRLVARRSRFEVDLNRPRESAVYVRPQDCWGLAVWRSDPPAELIERSRAIYDAFYREANEILSELARREGRFVVLDLHTYNHRRAGPGAAFDPQTGHPDVNVGTGTMERSRWAPIVDRAVAELSACDDLGRRLDVRENVKFYGGHFPRWIHETFPATGCAIAIEFKKFFMDEWSGQLYVDQHRAIGRLLTKLVAAIREELASLAA